MPSKQTLMGLVLGVAAATTSQAACLSDAHVLALANRYADRTPADNPEGLSPADADCTRAKLNALFAQRLGSVIGYKAGLTNPAVQKRFSTDQPVWGKLYEGMLLQNDASVPAKFGARPLYEADMLVRVKSAKINHAITPLQVLEAIDQVIPFIELPDLMVQTPSGLNGAAVSAINVGARMGVVGTPIAVPATRGERYALLDGLRDMQVTLTDANDVLLGSGTGSEVLGHPLNAVVWLVQALRKEDLTLQPGDVVSLGSFSPLLPPKPGLQVQALYRGLPGAAPVRVNFQ